jgi:hypothetical protein
VADLSYTVNIAEGTDGLKNIVAQLGAAAGGTQRLDIVIKGLGGSMQRAGEHAKRAGSGFQGVGHAVESAKHHVSNFFDFVGAGLAVEGIKKLAEMFSHLGHEIIGAAAGAERLDLSFKLTMGAEGAEDILGFVEAISSKTEFTDDKLKGWALQLANAGIKGENLKDTMAAVLDVAAKRGGGAGDLAADALTRATLSGKIEGRALRGLGIPVADLAQLDKFKGLNEKQINKSLETTSVTRDQLLELIAGSDKLLGDLGLEASKTLTAKIKNVSTIPEQLFQKFANSPAFETLKKKLDQLYDTFDPNGPRGKAVFAALENVFTTVVDQIEKIDFNEVADTITKDVLPALKSMAELIKPTVDAVLQIVRGFGVIGSVMPSLKTFGRVSVGIATGGTSEIASAIGGRIFGGAGPDRAPGPPIDNSAYRAATDPLLLSMRTTGGAAADALGAGLLSKTDFVGSAMTTVATEGIDALNKTWERHSPPAVFVRAGQDVPRAIAMGVEDEAGRLDSTMRGAFAAPSGDSLPSGLGGGIQISMPVNFTFGGDVSREAGEAAGHAAANALEGRVIEMFERIVARQGG